MARGRKPVGTQAMTAAERQQRHHDKYNAALPPLGSEKRFRLELYWWVQSQALLYPKLVSKIDTALNELACALRNDVQSLWSARARKPLPLAD